MSDGAEEGSQMQDSTAALVCAYRSDSACNIAEVLFLILIGSMIA